MTDVTSVFLEFKPVGNFHWIVNKSNTFSFDQMKPEHINNRFKFIPVQSCADGWRTNINQNTYALDPTKIVKCKYIDPNTQQEADVDPQAVELIASEQGYGGVIVTLATTTVITLTSTPQELKGVFLVNASNNVVLAYCILPESVKVNNYLQLSFTTPIIEIVSTVNTQFDNNNLPNTP